MKEAVMTQQRNHEREWIRRGTVGAISVLILTLARSAFPASSSSIWGDIDLGTGLRTLTPAGPQSNLHDLCYNPALDEYFVLMVGAYSSIWSQRVNAANGDLVGPQNRISPNYGTDSPAVAYAPAAHRYFVAWAAYDSTAQFQNVYGKVLDDQGAEVTGTALLDDLGSNQWHGQCDVAFDGTRFLVVWSRRDGAYWYGGGGQGDIRGRFFDISGQPS